MNGTLPGLKVFLTHVWGRPRLSRSQQVSTLHQADVNQSSGYRSRLGPRVQMTVPASSYCGLGYIAWESFMESKGNPTPSPTLDVAIAAPG